MSETTSAVEPIGMYLRCVTENPLPSITVLGCADNQQIGAYFGTAIEPYIRQFMIHIQVESAFFRG